MLGFWKNDISAASATCKIRWLALMASTATVCYGDVCRWPFFSPKSSKGASGSHSLLTSWATHCGHHLYLCLAPSPGLRSYPRALWKVRVLSPGDRQLPEESSHLSVPTGVSGFRAFTYYNNEPSSSASAHPEGEVCTIPF